MLAEHIVPVVGLRLLTGVGEALFLIGGLSIVNDLAPEHRRGEALSLYTLASYSGLAIGPVLGEVTLGDDRWNAVWLLAAGAAPLPGCSGCRAPETRPDEPPSEGGTLAAAPARARCPGSCSAWASSGWAASSRSSTLYALDIGLDGAGPLFAMFADRRRDDPQPRREDPRPGRRRPAPCGSP